MNRETIQRQTLSLDDVRDQVGADDLGKWDAVVPRQTLWMCDGRLLLPAAHRVGPARELSLTGWAGTQFCQKLGIPTTYFRRCPLQLQDEQANHWLRSPRPTNAVAACHEMNGNSSNGYGNNGHSEPHPVEPNKVADDKTERWTLRGKDAMLRGVLSEHYSPLDNSQLLDVLRPALDKRYRVDWFGLSEEALHLRIIDPSIAREVLKDDALSAGIHLSNSEVGLRAVTVDALVYRLVCSNGLIRLVKGKSLLKQRHIHISQPRFEVALEEAVQEALQTAGDFARQMEAATKQPLSDVEKTLEKLGIRFGLSQGVQEAAKRSMLRERPDQQSTVYGLINGLTRAAQDLPDEERYGLETLAGRLVESGLRGLDGDTASGRSRTKRRPLNGYAINGQAMHGYDPDAMEVSDDPAPWPLVERAAQIFDGEIVGRVPHEVQVPNEANEVEW